MSTKSNALSEAQSKEALGTVPSYQEAKLSHKFADMVATRQALDAQIAELEADKKDLSDQIFEQLAATGLKAVQVEEYRPTIIDQERRSISAERLLELGIPASVIERATEIKHSTFLRVFDTAKLSVRGKERHAGVKSIKGRR